jgi:hypothetical protein
MKIGESIELAAHQTNNRGHGEPIAAKGFALGRNQMKGVALWFKVIVDQTFTRIQGATP